MNSSFFSLAFDGGIWDVQSCFLFCNWINTSSNKWLEQNNIAFSKHVKQFLVLYLVINYVRFTLPEESEKKKIKIELQMSFGASFSIYWNESNEIPVVIAVNRIWFLLAKQFAQVFSFCCSTYLMRNMLLRVQHRSELMQNVGMSNRAITNSWTP